MGAKHSVEMNSANPCMAWTFAIFATSRSKIKARSWLS